MRKILLSLTILIGSVVNCYANNIENSTSKNDVSVISSPEKQKGYKGFIELGYNLGIGDLSIDRFEIQTSHGFKFSQCFYVGAGIGIEHYHDLDITAIPIFFDIRANILETFVSPSIGLKIGYSLKDIEGFYMSPSVGSKIDSFIVSVGYVMQLVKTDFGDITNEGITFKIGYSF